MLPTPPHTTGPFSQTTYQTLQQRTMPYATNTHPVGPLGSIAPVPGRIRGHVPKQSQLRIVAAVIIIVLAIALYFIWHTPTLTPTSPVVTQQNINTSSFSTNATSTSVINQASTQSDSSGDILVYVVGAVKHPGVYKLPANARVYQLLQAAGGPLPNANLVAINMAAKLNDGQEVYVAVIGETPPATGGVPVPDNGSSASGTLININTASVEQMRLALHISSKTAQKIIDYRLQHGPYTSVDQLLQVVSRSIYDKIKDLVTVS
jgi:competence protein ComEA